MEIKIFNKIVKVPVTALVLLAVFFMATGGVIFNKFNIIGENNEKLSVEYNSDSGVQTEAEENKDDICVYIVGCVKRQKVIYIKSGCTVAEIIEMSGGATKKADLSAVNLAYRPKDGEMITIPSKKETKANNSGNGANKVQKASDKVNINTAGIEELSTLNGIGDVTAEKIIEYRKNNGNFSSIEDIKNVSGIGEVKFSSIKEEITV